MGGARGSERRSENCSLTRMESNAFETEASLLRLEITSFVGRGFALSLSGERTGWAEGSRVPGDCGRVGPGQLAVEGT